MTALANVLTVFKETSDVTFKATAAVTGKRFVSPSGNRTGGPGLSTDLENVYQMAHCPAGARPAGVAKYDTPINTEGGIVGTPGRIVPVTAGANITAGQTVEVGANGQAIPLAAGIPAGLALTAAVSGADAEIKLL